MPAEGAGVALTGADGRPTGAGHSFHLADKFADIQWFRQVAIETFANEAFLLAAQRVGGQGDDRLVKRFAK